VVVAENMTGAKMYELVNSFLRDLFTILNRSK
jgi:vacuolar-type H+-ATPase catalytic subunit A/Vma1